ncbi:MAG TPA: hypothetical protein VHK69_10045 [Chitinophagaceae bacterium]|nr:hypothetical protein [Chitinophagaceae bacterium]
MKRLFILSLLATFTVNAQHKRPGPYGPDPYGNEDWKSVIKKGDSLEQRYATYTGLLHVTDTLPSDSNDEAKFWSRIKLVTYDYDAAGLKRIHLAHGIKADYFFYFEGPYLRKVVATKSPLIVTYYYFTINEHEATRDQLEQWGQYSPEEATKYDLLLQSRTFWERFPHLR